MVNVGLLYGTTTTTHTDMVNAERLSGTISADVRTSMGTHEVDYEILQQFERTAAAGVKVITSC